jgi:hypothetical protein
MKGKSQQNSKQQSQEFENFTHLFLTGIRALSIHDDGLVLIQLNLYIY